MESTWERIDENKVKLTIEVDEDRVEDSLDKAYKKVVKKVELPGFRKGKVPRKILENRFGPEVLYEDALEILVPEAYQEAIEENEIEPVAQPEIDVEQMEKGEVLKFTATVDVKPEPKLGEYKGLEVEKEKIEISEQQVEDELKRLQEQHAEYEQIEDGEAENGDRLVIDFKGYVDGEPLEGGEAENHNIEIGSDQFIPGFEEQLIGTKPGEEKEVNVTFPEEYPQEQISGKDAVFNVKVKEIKKKNLLSIDDELAKDVSDFESLDELKQDISNRLEQEAKEKGEQQVEEQVVSKAVENAEVNIPEPMIDQELDTMLKEFEQNLSYQGLDLNTYYKMANTDEDSLKEQFKDSAKNRVKRNLVLEAIRDEEGITASEEEVEEEIKKIAESANQDPEQIKEFLELQGKVSQVEDQIATKKAVDLLIDNAVVTEVEKQDTEENEAE
ncbi:trigger factor [Natranaerobius trueperi]|uniref:Trigger factor n=1 Tax=Natranaerobius trueperi TaxID=759412 RepID=A0A226C0I5_9FIRM|nr:trigger factor [Natranaerobius trueperi]OWZ83887.1 trigger factor [Natranaerobius trueperi]